MNLNHIGNDSDKFVDMCLLDVKINENNPIRLIIKIIENKEIKLILYIFFFKITFNSLFKELYKKFHKLFHRDGITQKLIEINIVGKIVEIQFIAIKLFVEGSKILKILVIKNKFFSFYIRKFFIKIKFISIKINYYINYSKYKNIEGKQNCSSGRYYLGNSLRLFVK